MQGVALGPGSRPAAPPAKRPQHCGNAAKAGIKGASWRFSACKPLEFVPECYVAPWRLALISGLFMAT